MKSTIAALCILSIPTISISMQKGHGKRTWADVARGNKANHTRPLEIEASPYCAACGKLCPDQHSRNYCERYMLAELLAEIRKAEGIGEGNLHIRILDIE